MEEIQKRPLVRPLFWWVIGIVLEVCFPLQCLSVVLLLPLTGVVLLPLVFRRANPEISYNTRWVWGMVIACVFVFLAIQFTANAERHLSEQTKDSWLQDKAQQVQLQMVGKMDALRLSDSEKAVLANITVNYRQTMTREMRSRFSAIGVAHLLSVSGFHVAIVCGFLAAIFSFFPKRRFFRWLRYVLMMALLWGFAAISGLSTPAVRASIMLSIYLTGQVLRRSPDRYNTLAAAAFCMLVYNPFYLFDVGFQLSFTAVFFILYLQPRFYRLLEIRNPLIASPWGVLTVTVAAQIGTLPLCCYYFGTSSTVFLFTNLFLSMLATVLIPLALIWLLLPSELPGYMLLQSAVEWLTHSLIGFVTRFSQVPGATIQLRFDFLTMLGVYGVLGGLIYYFRVKNAKILIFALFLLLVLLGRQIVLTR